MASYVGTKTSGSVSISGINIKSLKDHPVILVEDIIDTGLTLSQMIPKIQEEGQPTSIEVVSLLTKRHDSKETTVVETMVEAKYSGFSIPDEFVIGFGLDCNEWYRDLEDIWVISEKGKSFAL